MRRLRGVEEGLVGGVECYRERYVTELQRGPRWVGLVGREEFAERLGWQAVHAYLLTVAPALAAKECG